MGTENRILERTGSQLVSSLPIDPAYCFHLCYNQLISVCVPQEENSGAVYSSDIDIAFIFIAIKDKSTIVKCKLHPGQNNGIMLQTRGGSRIKLLGGLSSQSCHACNAL